MPSTFDTAILEFLRHGKSTLDLLDGCLAEQKDLSEASAFKGLALLMAAKPELSREISACANLSEEHSKSPLSMCLSSALSAGRNQGRKAAADILDTYDPCAPHSILTFKLSHQLRFMAGDHSGMLASAGNFVQRAHGQSFLSFAKGCFAFALEEAGRFEEAEALAREAVEQDSRDAWATHVVSHVYEMTDRPEEGLLWSREARPHYAHCNNFRYHMEWHEGLFHIRLRDFDAALQHYDNCIRPEPTDDYRDFANAASYLARLLHCDVRLGTRWNELCELAESRASEQELVFASLHRLLAFLAVKDFRGASEVASALGAQGATNSEQGWVAKEVGFPLAVCLIQLARGEAPEVGSLSELKSKLSIIGGSKVQREIFLDQLRRLLCDLGLRSEVALFGDFRERAAVREGF